jgi:glycosyltransferase involved in cell wall biosynthesis
MLATVPLNVLHISESDGEGGAARAAYRMHDGLDALGHTSRMLVGRKVTPDARTRPLKRNDAWRAADRLVGSPLDALGLQYVLYPSSFAVAADRWFRDADVVQLHNTHGSYFSHSALPLLSRRKRVVWFLHDMWAFTGHVTYSRDCERWLHGCGSCPYLDEYPRLERDTTAALWRWKRFVYAHSRLTIVTPSAWLAGLVERSPLLGRFATHVVPNGVDLERFRPGDARAARVRLGIDPDRPTILFAGADLADRRKGGDLLRDALRMLDRDVQLVVAGGASVPGLDAIPLGTLTDDEMPLAYAAADLYVLPSRADNFPNTVVESLACGTPVVAFRVGGVPELVRHLETGWLAEPEDASSLADGIRTVLDDAELRARLGAAARAHAERELGVALQAERLVEAYGSVAASA